jgi:hypothetical protein
MTGFIAGLEMIPNVPPDGYFGLILSLGTMIEGSFLFP